MENSNHLYPRFTFFQCTQRCLNSEEKCSKFLNECRKWTKSDVDPDGLKMAYMDETIGKSYCIIA